MEHAEKTMVSGDYIAGFVDGEGCFSLFYRKDIKKFKKSQKIYYEWKTCFAIVSRIDDANLLKNIKDTFLIFYNTILNYKAHLARKLKSKKLFTTPLFFG